MKVMLKSTSRWPLVLALLVLLSACGQPAGQPVQINAAAEPTAQPGPTRVLPTPRPRPSATPPPTMTPTELPTATPAPPTALPTQRPPTATPSADQFGTTMIGEWRYAGSTPNAEGLFKSMIILSNGYIGVRERDFLIWEGQAADPDQVLLGRHQLSTAGSCDDEPVCFTVEVQWSERYMGRAFKGFVEGPQLILETHVIEQFDEVPDLVYERVVPTSPQISAEQLVGEWVQVQSKPSGQLPSSLTLHPDGSISGSGRLPQDAEAGIYTLIEPYYVAFSFSDEATGALIYERLYRAELYGDTLELLLPDGVAVTYRRP